jgi:hypothetical protein
MEVQCHKILESVTHNPVVITFGSTEIGANAVEHVDLEEPKIEPFLVLISKANQVKKFWRRMSGKLRCERNKNSRTFEIFFLTKYKLTSSP